MRLKLLKISLLAVLVGVLTYQLSNGGKGMQWGEFWANFRTQWQVSNPFYLLLALLLVPCNWGVEVWKWRIFLGEAISRLDAIKAVLVGLAFSLFTPNRVGEYAGRVWYVPDKSRLFSIYSTLLGNLAQWLVILWGGLFSYSLGRWGYGLSFGLGTDTEFWIFLGFVGLGVGLWWAYYRVLFVSKQLIRFPYFKPRIEALLSQIETSAHTDTHLLRKTLALAGLRYLIYASQYVCLFWFWGLPLDILQGFGLVGMIYFFQTCTPLPPSLGLVARGSLALYLTHFYLDANTFARMQPAILATTFGLWLINICLPALVGGVFWMLQSKPRNV